MLSLRSLAGSALRGLRDVVDPDPDPEDEDEVSAHEVEALREELAGELDRVAQPSGVVSR